jgi:hypothetical protein
VNLEFQYHMKPQVQRLLLAASVLIVTLLRAQVVNDGATNTLSNDGRVTDRYGYVGRQPGSDRPAMGETDENRVQLLMTIGRQYQTLDEHAKARELLGKAYTLSRKLSEPAIRATVAAALGDAGAVAGEYERGETLKDHPETLEAARGVPIQ